MLILHVVEDPLSNPFRRVSVETARKVDRLIREFILPHGEVFYGKEGGEENLERTQTIASYVLTAGKTDFIPSDFTRNVRQLRGLGHVDLLKTVSPLVAGGWLDQRDKSRNYSTWKLRSGVAEQMEARLSKRKRENKRLLREWSGNAIRDNPISARSATPASAKAWQPSQVSHVFDKRLSPLVFCRFGLGLFDGVTLDHDDFLDPSKLLIWLGEVDSGLWPRMRCDRCACACEDLINPSLSLSLIVCMRRRFFEWTSVRPHARKRKRRN